MNRFHSGTQMLDYIQKGNDLYNPETNTYVFLYNESGSICVYDWISNDHALDLALTREGWSGYLGVGGYIYDDPSYEDYDDMAMDNWDWCFNNFKGKWIDTDEYLEWYKEYKEVY